MSTLYDIYKQQGKALPSTVEARFADPKFAAAAQQAGITQDQYRINAGNADMNTRIASLYGRPSNSVIQTTSATRAMDSANIQRLDTGLQRKSGIMTQQFANINGFQVPVSGSQQPVSGQPTPNAAPAPATQPTPNAAPAPATQQTSTSTTTQTTRTPEQQKAIENGNNFILYLDQHTQELTKRYEDIKVRASAENQLLVDTVKSKFNRLRNKMLDSNLRLMSQIEKNQYTSESFRYTPNQAAGTLVQAEKEAVDRLTALDEEENMALLQAAQAKTAQENDMLAEYLSQIDQINEKRYNVLKEQSKIALEIENSIAESKTVTTDGSIMPKSTKDQIDVAKNLAPFLLSQVSGLDMTAQENFFKSQAEKFGVPQELLKSATEEYRTERSDKVKTAKTSSGGGATKLTAAEKKTNALSMINMVLDARRDEKNDITYVDENGYITPAGLREILRFGRDKGISKRDILQEYGQQLYLDDLESYGLTGADIKLITAK